MEGTRCSRHGSWAIGWLAHGRTAAFAHDAGKQFKYDEDEGEEEEEEEDLVVVPASQRRGRRRAAATSSDEEEEEALELSDDDEEEEERGSGRRRPVAGSAAKTPRASSGRGKRHGAAAVAADSDDDEEEEEEGVPLTQGTELGSQPRPRRAAATRAVKYVPDSEEEEDDDEEADDDDNGEEEEPSSSSGGEGGRGKGKGRAPAKQARRKAAAADSEDGRFSCRRCMIDPELELVRTLLCSIRRRGGCDACQAAACLGFQGKGSRQSRGCSQVGAKTRIQGPAGSTAAGLGSQTQAGVRVGGGSRIRAHR